MKKLYIKLDQNRIPTSFTTNNKKTIDNQLPMDYDIATDLYPDDFKNDVRKYTIDIDSNFEVRDRYEDYQLYLTDFDYGLENHNTPLDYDIWIIVEDMKTSV